MTETDLERAFGPELTKLPGRWVYGGAYATRAIESVEIGGMRYRAMFQMSDADGRLQQVLLEPKRRPGQEAAFQALSAELTEAYGRPTGKCTVPRAGGGPLSAEYWWHFPTTTVHLTFFDFYSRAMAFDDPNVDPDPLTPYADTRRNNPRFLPRRTLVRYHPTSRDDLMSVACKQDAR